MFPVFKRKSKFYHKPETFKDVFSARLLKAYLHENITITENL